MARDAMRAMLDELMGRDRNRNLGEEREKPVEWTESKVCPYFLCGLCPYDVFTNTKSSLGPCQYDYCPVAKYRDPETYQLHNEEDPCVKEFKAAPYKDKRNIMRQALRFYQKLVEELDRKIERTKMQIGTRTSDDNPLMNSEKIREIDERIATLTHETEKAGEDGDVDKAMKLMADVTALEKEKTQMIASSQETAERLTAKKYSSKDMVVCETCGVVLLNSANDPSRRQIVESGRQFKGWKMIREKIPDLHEEFVKEEEELKASGEEFDDSYQERKPEAGQEETTDDDNRDREQPDRADKDDNRRQGRTPPRSAQRRRDRTPPKRRRRSRSRSRKRERRRRSRSHKRSRSRDTRRKQRSRSRSRSRKIRR